MTIYYHDDFDGIAAAVILGEFFQRRLGYAALAYQSVGYYLGERWFTMPLNVPAAVVDFQYRPGLQWWFDHHETSGDAFARRAGLDKEEVYDLLRQGSVTHCFDPSARSGARVVLNHLRGKFLSSAELPRQEPERWEELAQWADVIDSAAYESCEQVIESKEPALRIRLAIQYFNLSCEPGEKEARLADLISMLQTRSLSDAAEHDDIARAAAQAKAEQDIAIDYFQRVALCEAGGKIVVADMTGSPVSHCRYAPYLVEPDCFYSVVVVGSQAKGFNVMVGMNPWNRLRGGVSVGQLCGQFGGGGHAEVGGVSRLTREQVREVVGGIVSELRKSLKE